ncbi:Arylsulfotransferase-domain-containing protein [Xylariaceae sp. FL0804]|nr:Arylsulfotransferase-domain-containing protein [Xylariaceae sp. FL0804]
MALRSVLGAVVLFGGAVSCADLLTDYDAYNAATWGTFPRLNFKSIQLDAPRLLVSMWNKEAMSKTGSHIFLRHDGHHDGAKEDSSPLILSADDLSVVYMNRTFDAVFDVRVQQDFDKSYLTFYGGPMTEVGLGNGYAHAYDDQYNEVYLMAAQDLSVKGDIHECQFTGHGTVMVTAYEARSYDLSHLAGSQFRYAQLVDSVFQEIELATNKVLFEWRASEHVDMAGSFQRVERRWDYFHLNSIQKTRTGNYLLSARHMHAIYLIDGTTGDIIWTLGGKANDFTELSAFGDDDPREASNPVLTMSWQHHARFYQGNESEITLFDNHNLAYNGYGCERDCSRGIHFAIDAQSEPKTVRLLHEYLHPVGLQSQSQGSVQVLDDGNVFVGWGRNPSFTEHTPDGETVFSVQFSPWRSQATQQDGLDNYRAFRMDWKATPSWPPDIAVEQEAGNGSSTAYVSWNGATEVKYWALLASDTSSDIDGVDKVIATLPRSGFETTVPLGTDPPRYVRAAALDANHTILGSTGIFDTVAGNTTATDSAITAVLTSTMDVATEEAVSAPSGWASDSASNASTSSSPDTSSDSGGAVSFAIGTVVAVGLVFFGVGACLGYSILRWGNWAPKASTWRRSMRGWNKVDETGPADKGGDEESALMNAVELQEEGDKEEADKSNDVIK